MIGATYDSCIHDTKLVALGCLFATIGATANTILVFANRGWMPVVTKKYRDSFSKQKPIHRLAKDGDRFLFLADRFDIWLGIFSIGDILIVLGIVMIWIYYR